MVDPWIIDYIRKENFQEDDMQPVLHLPIGDVVVPEPPNDIESDRGVVTIQIWNDEE